MDILQEYAVHAYTLFNNVYPYTLPVRQTFSAMQSQTMPLITPLLDRASALAHESPAIITVGVFILLLLIALQILNVVRRIMMFWVSIVARLLFWGAFGLLISLVIQRGVGRTVEDLRAWGEEIGRVWWREYRRWEGAQKQTKGGGYPGRAGTGSGSKHWS